ncbi:MAG: hypothetical protein ORN51_07115 [Akkermansiaceae bacterium]|nr:hypothetical protein [Akkermansiaceae bacterium]
MQRAIRRVGKQDPRFQGLIPPEYSLQSAIDAGILIPDEVRVTINRILRLGTIEKQVSDLIAAADGQAFKNPSPDRRKALEARFGVHDRPTTLDGARELVGRTRERMRQFETKVKPLLRGAWIPALEEAALVLVEASPVAPPIGFLLSTRGLSAENMSAEQFLALVDLVELDIEEIAGTTLVYEDQWLVDERELTVTDAVNVARKHTSKFGMTTVAEIQRALADEQQVPDTDDLMRVLEGNPDVRWAGDWLWVEKARDSAHSNSLINKMRNMLSVNSPLTAASLHDGVARAFKPLKRSIVPTEEAILAFAAASPYFTVEGNLISPIDPLDYRATIGQVAASLVEVFKASPYGAMDRQSLSEACEIAGIKHGTLNRWTTYSEIIESFGWNVWGLRGSNVPESIVHEIQQSAQSLASSEPRRRDWHRVSDHLIVLTMDADRSSRTTATWLFDSGLRSEIGGRRFEIIAEGKRVGTASTGEQHNWTWGWSPAIRELSIQPGDVVRAVLDLKENTATVTKGGTELWDRTETAATALVELVSVEAVPEAAINTERAEFKRAASGVAEQREAALTMRFRTFLENSHGREVKRYKIATSAGALFTDTADITAGVLYEAKAHADRMSVRLALGQILDYSRYVQGVLLAVLLPEAPPADLVELLEAHNIGCVVEGHPGEFTDITKLQRCP